MRGISHDEAMGYNWWHKVKEISPFYAGLADDIVNPVSTALQRLAHSITGQQTIRNLDGSPVGSATAQVGADGNNSPLDIGMTVLMALIPIKLGSGQVVNKEIQSLTSRIGKNGKAIRIEFTDGSAMDINSVRVKEFTPNTHPSAPPGATNPVYFDDAIPGSKGKKRLPNANDMNLLNTYYR